MKITEIFPKSELLSKTTASWKEDVTLYDLLTGNSKLPHSLSLNCEDLDFINTVVDPQLIFNALKQVDDHTEDAVKDAHFTNYYILAKLLEEFTHLTYEELFERHLNLENTHAPIDGNFSDIANKYDTLPIRDSDIEIANLVGSANIISSAEDLVRFYEHMFLHSDIGPVIKEIFYQEEEGVLYDGKKHINTKHYAEESDVAGHHVKIYHFQHSEDEQDYMILLDCNDLEKMPKSEIVSFD